MLPALEDIAYTTSNISEFDGINQREKIGNYEFESMKNMTSDNSPYMSPRQRREYTNDSKCINPITVGRRLYYLQGDGEKYYLMCNGKKIKGTLKGEELENDVTFIEPQQLALMGAYIVAIPSNLVFNTEDNVYELVNKYDEASQLINTERHLNSFDTYCNIVYMSDSEGKAYIDCTREMVSGVTDVEQRLIYNDGGCGSIPITRDKTILQNYYNLEPEEKPMLLSINDESIAIERYQANMYIISESYLTVRLKMDNVGIVNDDFISLESFIGGSMIEDGDMFADDNDKNLFELLRGNLYVKNVKVSSGTGGTFLYLIIGNKNIWNMTIEKNAAAGTDDAVKYSYLPLYRTNNTKVAINRKMPELDFICSCGNRLWGCSSGNHEIYASKLGDPLRWYQYSGLSTDSYTMTVGSVGDFTGASVYGNTPVFFKEDMILMIYGTKPSNYQLQEYKYPGVEKGNHKSIAIMGTDIFYKAKDGIRVFSGSSSTLISEKIKKSYHSAVAGIAKDKYYISMINENKRALFVYDVSRGVWHTEDDIDIVDFVNVGNNLYAFTSDNIVCIKKNEAHPEEFDFGNVEPDVSWEAISGNLMLESMEHKYINKIVVRVHADDGARIAISAMYDDNGKWEVLQSYKGRGNRVQAFPILPKRCDRIKLKYSGTGKAKILGIEQQIMMGSEL